MHNRIICRAREATIFLNVALLRKVLEILESQFKVIMGQRKSHIYTVIILVKFVAWALEGDSQRCVTNHSRYCRIVPHEVKLNDLMEVTEIQHKNCN